MCGRYTLTVEAGDLAERFGVHVPERYEPRYNAAPRQSLPVVRTGVDVDDEHAPEDAAASPSDGAADLGDASDGGRELACCEWGLVPSWVDEPDDANRPINARSETVREKRSFRDAYERRRCLVPADGFYEWTERGGGKQPYRVTLDDGSVFAMAGLYEVWEGEVAQSSLAAFGADGDDDRRRRVESFTVLTTEPNDVVADLHHRMAVVLDREDESTWLHGDPDEAASLLEPYDGAMRSYPVSTAVNDPGNESPGLLDPVDV
jgi:putative SOS response-associated peptidase YedK